MIGPRAPAEFSHLTQVHAVAPALSVVTAIMHALTVELSSALFWSACQSGQKIAVAVSRSGMALGVLKVVCWLCNAGGQCLRYSFYAELLVQENGDW